MELLCRQRLRGHKAQSFLLLARRRYLCPRGIPAWRRKLHTAHLSPRPQYTRIVHPLNYTEQELQVIHDAARTISYAFGAQFPGVKRQLQLLEEDEQFRAVNQIIIQSHNVLRVLAIKRGDNPDV